VRLTVGWGSLVLLGLMPVVVRGRQVLDVGVEVHAVRDVPVLVLSNHSDEDWSDLTLQADGRYLASRAHLPAGLAWRLTPDALLDSNAWLLGRIDPYYAGLDPSGETGSAPPDYRPLHLVFTVGAGAARRTAHLEVPPSTPTP
jgi:hypothetical protein